MSIDNMPIDKYGYFNLVIGHIESYYRIDRPEKARKVTEFLVNNFRERIIYYSGLDAYELSLNFGELESTLDLYRYVIATCVEYDTEEYSSKLKQDFMDSVTLLGEVLEAAE